MKSIRWLDEAVIRAIHAEQLAEHGGRAGLRDPGLLASAIARPRQHESYVDPGLFTLAAAYAFGIARNHPFVDGNKRTALVSCFTFLAVNGWEVMAPETEAVEVFTALASGALEQDTRALWLECHSQPTEPEGQANGA